MTGERRGYAGWGRSMAWPHPSRIGGGIMMSRISIATSAGMSDAWVSRNATTECVQAS